MKKSQVHDRDNPKNGFVLHNCEPVVADWLHFHVQVAILLTRKRLKYWVLTRVFFSLEEVQEIAVVLQIRVFQNSTVVARFRNLAIVVKPVHLVANAFLTRDELLKDFVEKLVTNIDLENHLGIGAFKLSCQLGTDQIESTGMKVFVGEVHEAGSKSFVVQSGVNELLLVVLHVELVNPHPLRVTHGFVHH